MIRTEQDLYCLWEERAEPGRTLHAVAGERVTIVSRGRRNVDAGPDYREAVLIVDGKLVVGSVEMHVREAEWFAHGHQHDPAYSSVILHLVDVVAGSPVGLPTILSSELAAGRPDDSASSSYPPSVSHDLLAELSWSRLLRRTLEVVRDVTSRDASSRDDGNALDRAYLIRLFDCLGYSRNREPMKRLAENLWKRWEDVRDRDFDATAAFLFALSGARRDRLEKIGRGFIPEERLAPLLPVEPPQDRARGWDVRVRPANEPERRLWAGAKLLFDLSGAASLDALFDLLRGGASEKEMRRVYTVRLGSETILGRSRADDIVVNALIPVALASGVLRGDHRLIEAACLLYRGYPSLASNRPIRRIEAMLPHGNCLDGAFLQQGAIEYFQQYLSPSHGRPTIVAEA